MSAKIQARGSFEGPRFAKYQQDFLGAVLRKSEYTIAEAERAVKAFFKDKERD